MNARDKAHQISAAIVTTQNRLNYLEKELAWTQGNADEIKRLRRVLKALDRDLDQIVATIPAPVQFDFFSSVEPRQSALEEPKKPILLWQELKDLTPQERALKLSQHSETQG